MGISKLIPTLRKVAPLAFLDGEDAWAPLVPRGSRVAVDVAPQYCRYAFGYGVVDERRIEQDMMRWGRAFRARGWEPVFVFDGGLDDDAPPPLALKDAERARRAAAALKAAIAKQKRQAAAGGVTFVPVAAVVKPRFEVVEDDDDGAAAAPVTPAAAPAAPAAAAQQVQLYGAAVLGDGSILSPASALADERDASGALIVTAGVSPEMLAAARDSIVKPTKDNYRSLRAALLDGGWECATAQYEAEALCAYLCSQGRAVATFTVDTDAVAFGCETIICGYGTPTSYAIRLREVLRATGLSRVQLQQALILFGTDFNEGIAGYGPAKILPAMRTARTAVELVRDGAKAGVAQLRTAAAQEFASTLLPQVCELFASFCGEARPFPPDGAAAKLAAAGGGGGGSSSAPAMAVVVAATTTAPTEADDPSDKAAEAAEAAEAEDPQDDDAKATAEAIAAREGGGKSKRARSTSPPPRREAADADDNEEEEDGAAVAARHEGHEEGHKRQRRHHHRHHHRHHRVAVTAAVEGTESMER